MHSELDLFPSTQNSLAEAPPPSPFQLQPLHLSHDQILKDAANHEPAKRIKELLGACHECQSVIL